MQESGLSEFLGEVLTVFAPLPVWVITLLIAVFVSVLTEITSNTAVVSIVTPIITSMVSQPTVLVADLQGVGQNRPSKPVQMSVNGAIRGQRFSTQNGQKPFVGRTPPGPVGGAHSAPQSINQSVNF